ncbi:hypothetical protein LEP1GSC021_4198 [Leptospira noguchii str. 1993005606]|nr:hypothetical protein LEP1GSC021_4198 [Leptospira noguchii str. 1993005606]
MNRHLVFISWKRSIEVVLLIVSMESFNNSIAENSSHFLTSNSC